MRVIVVGCGRVGSELAVRLQRDGHDVAIIDKNRNAFRRLPDDWGGPDVVGFGFDRDDLLEAGIEQASAVAAVTSGDNTNILTARIARETFEIPHVVARIYDPRPGRDLPAAGHPDRGHGELDGRPGRPPPAARGGRHGLDRPDRVRSTWSSTCCRRRSAGGAMRSWPTASGSVR